MFLKRYKHFVVNGANTEVSRQIMVSAAESHLQDGYSVLYVTHKTDIEKRRPVFLAKYNEKIVDVANLADIDFSIKQIYIYLVGEDDNEEAVLDRLVEIVSTEKEVFVALDEIDVKKHKFCGPETAEVALLNNNRIGIKINYDQDAKIGLQMSYEVFTTVSRG